MALNEEFSLIYQDTSTDILCGPLQQLEDPAVLMLLQPHEQQQQHQHTADPDVHNLQFDDSSGPISSLSSSFLPISQTTNNDNTNKKRKASAPSLMTTATTTTTATANGEVSPETETCWASPTLETAPNSTTSSSNTSSTQRR